MDIEQFYEVSREAMNLQSYDTWLIGERGPVPSTDQPTAETLQELTDKLIEYETGLAFAPQELNRLDDLASRLNYFYDPEYAAQPDPPDMRRDNALPSVIRWRYETSVARLAEVRASLNDQVQVLQALVSTYTAARAKVEHDLAWQEYVRTNFGVDPSAIPREKARRPLALLEAA
jgi:hypothetical protein